MYAKNQMKEGKFMNLNTSKMILKVFGIISIIFGIIGIVAGILAIAGGALIGAGAAAGEVTASSEMAGGVALLGFGGLLIIIGSVVELLSGIFSVKASNDISKIMPAWWFALISLVMGIVNIIVMVVQKSQATNTSNIVSAVIGLLISILIFVAANTIKKAAGK